MNVTSLSLPLARLGSLAHLPLVVPFRGYFCKEKPTSAISGCMPVLCIEHVASMINIVRVSRSRANIQKIASPSSAASSERASRPGQLPVRCIKLAPDLSYCKD